MRDEIRDENDSLLDFALSSYVSAELRPGFENRVIRRVETEGFSHRARWSIRLFPAVSFAILLCIAIAFWYVRKPEQHTADSSSFTQVRPQPKPAEIAAVRHNGISQTPIALVRDRRRSAVRPGLTIQNLAKQAVFPSPAPLTREERALLSLMKYHSEAMTPASASGPQSVEPIQIAAIEIKPLPDSGSTQGEQ